MMVPLQQLEPGDDAKSWRSQGKEPLFQLEGNLPWPGWNMIEIASECSGGRAVATLTLESSRRQVVYTFPLRNGKAIKRLVYVPWGVRRVTFAPMGSVGQFAIQSLKFVWLTPHFAYSRLLQRLSSMHRHYRDLPLHDVMKSLKQQARTQSRKWQVIALEDYDSTFLNMSIKHHYQKWIRSIEQRRTPDSHDLHAKGDFACSVLLVSGGLQKETALFKARLNESLASLAEQSLGPRQVVLLLSPEEHQDLKEWLDEWQHELTFLNVVESCAQSVAAQRLEALSYSEHTWVWFLRPGDRLAEHALYHAANIQERHPEAHILVADEDSLDEQGVRHSPRFKPDFNPDLLLSMPYMGRAVCFRRDYFPRLSNEECGKNANNPDWLDYAQFLSFTRRDDFTFTSLAHVPHVAYHGLQGDAEGNYVPLVKEHLDQQQEGVRVTHGLLPSTQRVRWPMPEPKPLVTLLVPTRDGVNILRPCVNAILERTDYSHFELLILDNQSSCAETLAYLKGVEARDSRVKVLHWNHSFNYSAINNFGAANAKGSIIGLINNDIEPMEGTWLTEMVEQVSRPEIGCVGAKLYYPNDTVQHGGVILGLGGLAGHAHRFFQRDEDGYMGRLKVIQNLSAVTAACLLVRKSVFDEVNGLNETDLAVAYNDVDLCIKVREAGYRNLWTPYAALYHHESVSRGADDTPEKRARWLSEYAYMRNAWGELLDSDPAYNPNLTLVHEDFSLR
ncbi:glycosyltransferase family 2 protein [Halomonas sp. AOP1-B1-8]